MNPAYRETVFRLEGPEPRQPFWIVTAHNPEGRIATEDSNHRNDEALLGFLRSHGESPVRATGLSPDETHAEPGWTIRSEELALQAAEWFRQEALYRIEEDTLILVDLASGKEGPLGPWRPRIRFFPSAPN